MDNAFICFSIGFYLFKQILKKEKLSIQTPLNLPFLCFILAGLLSIKNSFFYAASVQGVLKLIKYGFIFLICARQIQDRKHIARIIIAIAIGISLVTIDGLWQMAFGTDFIRGNTMQQAIGLPRSTAAFPNPNVMGIYLSAISPLIIGLTLFYYQGRQKAVMAVVSVLAVIGIGITLSRGTILALYTSILFLSIVHKRKILIALLLALIFISPFVIPKKMKDWAKEVNYNPAIIMLNKDRISIYKNAVNMIKHHPVIGVGINTFVKNYGMYKLVEAEKECPTPQAIYAHNSFLQMTGEIGLLGLVVFLWLLVRLFKENTRIYLGLDDRHLKVASISLMACLIAFLINSLSETSMYYPRVTMIFWYMTGFSLALSKFIIAKTN
jgi:O-antigen ligase